MTGYNAYRNSQVNVSTPLELTLLAYEVLTSALHRTLIAHHAQDFVIEAEQSHRALRALSEMLGSLDYDQGGQLAANLGSLYAYMTKQILLAQTDDAEKLLNEVLGIANELRSGWWELKEEQQQTREAMPSRLAMAA